MKKQKLLEWSLVVINFVCCSLAVGWSFWMLIISQMTKSRDFKTVWDASLDSLTYVLDFFPVQFLLGLSLIQGILITLLCWMTIQSLSGLILKINDWRKKK